MSNVTFSSLLKMSLVYLPLHPPTTLPLTQIIQTPTTLLPVEQPSIVISPPPAFNHQFVERTFPVTIQTATKVLADGCLLWEKVEQPLVLNMIICIKFISSYFLKLASFQITIF